jgi:WXG100 family type VII secretion target
MNTLRINYDQMRAIAADVARCAADAREALAVLRAEHTALKPTWDGRARLAFDAAEAHCNTELAVFAPMLDQIHQALLQTAERIQTSEAAAQAQIAEIVSADAPAAP